MTDEKIKIDIAHSVDKYASQCVKCALCLPFCPTYGLTQDENESPRGRIALFQALAQEKLPLTQQVETHLDQCLGCRECERVCPAHVEYGKLLTLGRSLMQDLPAKGVLSKPSITLQFLNWVLIKPRLRRGLHWVLWFIEVTGIRKISRTFRLVTLFGLKNLDDLLPPVKKPFRFQSNYTPIGLKKGNVSLFTGCITSLCDEETLAAGIYLLRHLGMEIKIPFHQNCCGAIPLHSGNRVTSYQLAKQNVQTFLSPSEEPIISFATGCSAVLHEYNQNFSLYSNPKDADLFHFGRRITDIVSFLLHCEWPESLKLKALPFKVIIHTPCTRRNVLKTPADVEKLIMKIPQLQYQSFKVSHCCGSAGTYMLEHPSLAQPLVENLLSELDDIQVDYVVTSNIGCSLHMLKSLKNRHPRVKVVHPITLLAWALGFKFCED